MEGQPKYRPPFISQRLLEDTVMSSLCNNKCRVHVFMKEAVQNE